LVSMSQSFAVYSTYRFDTPMTLSSGREAISEGFHVHANEPAFCYHH